MNYWEDMNDKYGFNDGESVPAHAELYREAYVLAINTLCEKVGSTTRVETYNRPGMHNWCLITFKTNEDDLFVTAMEMAERLEVDSYVVTKARLRSQALIRDLKKLKP